jgi:peptidoglycan/LPS O-acetylase OafA/YrhL
VSLFFVLSGFVITRILIHTRRDEQYFTSFFVRRALRIAPLYYLFLIFWFYVLPFIINFPIAPASMQLPYVFYLQNLWSTFRIPLSGPPHFWSLAVEEHFYLVWPFIVYYVPVKNLNKVILSGIGFSFVIKYLMIQRGLSIHDFTLTRIDQILMGSFLAVLELKSFYKQESIRHFLKVAMVILLAAVAVYLLGTRYHFLKELFKYSLLGITFAALIGLILSLKPGSVINIVLESRPLQYLGTISYGIYVWHVIPLILMQHLWLTGVMALDLAIAVIMSIIFAHVSYYYFEVVFIRLKDQIRLAPVYKMLSHGFSMSRAVISRNVRRSN